MRVRDLLLHLRSSPLRHGLAIGSLIVAGGGMMLLNTPRSGGVGGVAVKPAMAAPAVAEGGGVSFAGKGAHGTLALSHRAAFGPGERRVYAELKLTADADPAKERAPVSLVVALDTSGSMGGEKIQQAKDAVVRLISEMRDEDEIAFLRYSDGAQLVQPLARVGAVRQRLIGQVRELQAGGGTNIPGALAQAMSAVGAADSKRVRRLVLVSDGLDSGRLRSEAISQEAAGKGVAVSSLGVGLDFDESYMASVARVGRGNFAFVKEGAELAKFLRQELDESASTVIEGTTVRLQLPEGVTTGQVTGATLTRDGGKVELQLGSLFAGEERRVIVELFTRLPPGETRIFQGDYAWNLQRGGDRVAASWGKLSLLGTADPAEESRGVNGAVLADAASVLTSLRQLEATEAYARGDGARAQALIKMNLADLNEAQAVAPAAASAALQNQARAYGESSVSFAASHDSVEGKAAAKRSYSRDVGNLRSSKY